MYYRTMENKINEYPLQSAESELEFPRNDSTENIISSEDTKPSCTTQRVFVSAIDTINHILIASVTLFIVYYAAKEYSVTNVHVILCTIGVSIPLICASSPSSSLVYFKIYRNSQIGKISCAVIDDQYSRQAL